MQDAGFFANYMQNVNSQSLIVHVLLSPLFNSREKFQVFRYFIFTSLDLHYLSCFCTVFLASSGSRDRLHSEIKIKVF